MISYNCRESELVILHVVPWHFVSLVGSCGRCLNRLKILCRRWVLKLCVERSLRGSTITARCSHSDQVWPHKLRVEALCNGDVICLTVRLSVCCRQKLSSLDLWYLLMTNTYAFQRTRSWSPRMILSNSKPWPHSPLMAYCVDPSGDTFDESVLL